MMAKRVLIDRASSVQGTKQCLDNPSHPSMPMPIATSLWGKLNRLLFDWHHIAGLTIRLENTVRKGYLWIPSEIGKSMQNGKV